MSALVASPRSRVLCLLVLNDVSPAQAVAGAVAAGASALILAAAPAAQAAQEIMMTAAVSTGVAAAGQPCRGMRGDVCKGNVRAACLGPGGRGKESGDLVALEGSTGRPGGGPCGGALGLGRIV